MAILIRCQVEGSDTSLEVPLNLYQNVLAARPVGHIDRPSTLIQLATVHLARFEKWKDEIDRAWAEAYLLEAMEFIPTESHEMRAVTFMFQLTAGDNGGPAQVDGQSRYPDAPSTSMVPLAAALNEGLIARFERFGDLADLQQAILFSQEMVRSIPAEDVRYCGALATLGLARWHRFNRLGELSDLEEAIAMFTDAIDLTTRRDPYMPTFLNNLGNAFVARFERFGELSDLEEAISIQRDAVDLTPHGHRHKLQRLNNLCVSLKTRFQRLGEQSDLQNAIEMLRGAFGLAIHGHPDKAMILNSLGSCFLTRFERFGELSDIENATSILGDAIALIPQGHPDKPTYLGHLGHSFAARFERFGDLSNLEQAISMFRGAVDFTPQGHPRKPHWLNGLGSCYLHRFKRLWEPSDLEHAVSCHKDAIHLTPHGHPHKHTLLNNLGITFSNRFLSFGNLSDLEDAISMERDAVDLVPHGHPDKPRWLYSLGNFFNVRFEHLKELSDLEQAILAFRDAIDLTPHGSPYKPTILTSLGNSLVNRFKRLGELSDLDHAILVLKDAVNLTLDGHPEKPAHLYNLGYSFEVRFEHFEELSNLEQAISLYLCAASSPIGSIKVRFLAAKQWISCARRISHHSLLHAYSVSIGLLPQLAWIGLSLEHRYDELKQGADVVRDAAAAALDSGLPETAVEWLEQGRSIVWGELLQLRSSYEELSSAHPDHAHRLQELSATLEQASAIHETISSTLLEQTQSAVHRPMESLEQVAVRHRMLAIARDKLLWDIRGLPGFERFLLHKDFTVLRISAHSGPLVMLNAAESRCDALIVLADVDHVIHVPLPTFTFKRSTGLQKMLVELLGHARVGNIATQRGVNWEPLLSTLWNQVVRPVLDALAFSVRAIVSLEFITDLFISDSWGPITHILVSDRPFHISSYSWSRFLRHPAFSTWTQSIRFRHLIIRPHSYRPCAVCQAHCGT